MYKTRKNSNIPVICKKTLNEGRPKRSLLGQMITYPGNLDFQSPYEIFFPFNTSICILYYLYRAFSYIHLLTNKCT